MPRILAPSAFTPIGKNVITLIHIIKELELVEMIFLIFADWQIKAENFDDSRLKVLYVFKIL